MITTTVLLENLFKRSRVNAETQDPPNPNSEGLSRSKDETRYVTWTGMQCKAGQRTVSRRNEAQLLLAANFLFYFNHKIKG